VVRRERLVRREPAASSAANQVRVALDELVRIDRAALDEPRQKRYDDVIARLRLVEAERLYEQLLRTAYPSGLDLSPGAKGRRSRGRFVAWLRAADGRTRRASEAYAAVESSRGASARVRSAACQGAARSFAWFASELESAEIPVDVRTGPYAADAAEAFCDEMRAQAVPLRKRAKAEADCANP
jgi:hypothetical protein